MISVSNQMGMKRLVLVIALALGIFSVAYSHEPEVRFNPWELIIYRPENSWHINEKRCWLKICDMEGNDVTRTCCKAWYFWVSNPRELNNYESSCYLSGGMAMYMNIKKGRYKISVFTPKSELVFASVSNKNDWVSNEFVYDTENPAKVIFVYPGADDNGFYSGQWIVSHRAPKFWKFTLPPMKIPSVK